MTREIYLWWVTTGASMIMVGAVTVGLRKFPKVRVHRRTTIVQNWHNTFSSDHRVVKLEAGLGLVHVPRCALGVVE